MQRVYARELVATAIYCVMTINLALSKFLYTGLPRKI
jgi:hypothetical protein